MLGCPFCGENVSMYTTGREECNKYHHKIYYFYCLVCNVEFKTKHTDVEGALFHWNKRYCDDCVSDSYDPPSKPGFGND